MLQLTLLLKGYCNMHISYFYILLFFIICNEIVWICIYIYIHPLNVSSFPYMIIYMDIWTMQFGHLRMKLPAVRNRQVSLGRQLGRSSRGGDQTTGSSKVVTGGHQINKWRWVQSMYYKKMSWLSLWETYFPHFENFTSLFQLFQTFFGWGAFFGEDVSISGFARISPF